MFIPLKAPLHCSHIHPFTHTFVHWGSVSCPRTLGPEDQGARERTADVAVAGRPSAVGTKFIGEMLDLLCYWDLLRNIKMPPDSSSNFQLNHIKLLSNHFKLYINICLGFVWDCEEEYVRTRTPVSFPSRFPCRTRLHRAGGCY